MFVLSPTVSCVTNARAAFRLVLSLGFIKFLALPTSIEMKSVSDPGGCSLTSLRSSREEKEE